MYINSICCHGLLKKKNDYNSKENATSRPVYRPLSFFNYILESFGIDIILMTFHDNITLIQKIHSESIILLFKLRYKIISTTMKLVYICTFILIVSCLTLLITWSYSRKLLPVCFYHSLQTILLNDSVNISLFNN